MTGCAIRQAAAFYTLYRGIKWLRMHCQDYIAAYCDRISAGLAMLEVLRQNGDTKVSVER
ncbi:hypothetical protein P279_09490 [Rhodobacteraceae bacterium PD-2]|nr:hypothetical protein P279_09490 [Rhodobacteraceae bacterium PD-2]